jgi:hypothetical protein
MGCRMNQRDLTPAQKAAFVNAVLALKNKVPSQLGLTNRYDDYVQTHMNSMMASPGWAHQGPAFEPWHRELLYQFEKDLQAVDPTVSLPYWDWTVDQDPTLPTSPFTNDFMGGNGDPGQNDKVLTGPFAHDAGNWNLNVISNDASVGDTVNYLRRQFAVSAPTLPAPQDLNFALQDATYDVAGWNRLSPSGFRNHAEGWIAAGADQPPQNHNRVHVWVGGTMLPMTSPNDPIFWLNHCNVDRLWSEWQKQNPASTPYLPSSGASPGHNLNDNMIFFQAPQPAPWSGTATPASIVNHHVLGYWYDTDAPTVTLLTPSLSFTDIPAGVGGTGVTTYRGIEIEVESCNDVTFEITAGPTTGFGAPTPSVIVQPDVTALTGLSPSVGRLWISYASTTPGSSITGSVTVQAKDSGTGTVFGPWVINLSANTVQRPTSAVTLVLDRSGSMALDAGNGQTRVGLLRNAVSTFIDVMQQGDGIGIVRFDNLVDTLMPVTDVGPIPAVPGSGRDQAQNIATTHDPATTIDPRGSTCIGGGILAGKAALDAASPTFTVRAMIVLTDGLENTPPMIADVSSSLTANTFAIGFGQAASISTSALNAITQSHGGYLVVTGPITPDQNFALTEYFLKIQAGINNSSAVLDPRGELILGVTHRIPFKMTDADIGVDALLLSPAPYYIDFRLESPDGTIIDPVRAASEPAIQFVRTPRTSYYRASLPMLASNIPGSHGGQWYALLSLGKRAENVGAEFMSNLRSPSLPYSLLVHVHSNLSFKANITQNSFVPGASSIVSVVLNQYDVPLPKGTSVAWAEISRPDGSSTVMLLNETDGGRFSAPFVTSITGVYTVLVRSRGLTLEGQNFERQQHLTAVVFPGGDQPPVRGDNNGLCRILHCLLNEKVLGSELPKLLGLRGINLRALEECLKESCQPSAGELGGEKPYMPGTTSTPMVSAVALTELRTSIDASMEARTASEGTARFATVVVGEPRQKPPVDEMIPNFGINLSKRKMAMKDSGGHKKGDHKKK